MNSMNLDGGDKPKIGNNVYIHPTAYIGKNVVIEDDVYIGMGCVIGSFAEHPHIVTQEWGTVLIKRGTKMTKLVTVDCPLEPHCMTIIGENCYLMGHSHCGHDVVLKDNVTLSCGVKVGGHSIIESHSTLGLNSTVHQFSHVREGCMIGANAFFKGESERFGMYVGVPAKKIGDNKRLKEKLGL